VKAATNPALRVVAGRTLASCEHPGGESRPDRHQFFPVSHIFPKLGRAGKDPAIPRLPGRGAVLSLGPHFLRRTLNVLMLGWVIGVCRAHMLAGEARGR